MEISGIFTTLTIGLILLLLEALVSRLGNDIDVKYNIPRHATRRQLA